MQRSTASGIVFQVRRFSTRDGPGLRTTVFMKSCPLSCAWCHNPEGRSPDPELVVFADRCVGCNACVAVCSTGAVGGGPVTDRTRCAGCGACAEVCYAEARTIAGRHMHADAVLAEIARDAPFHARSGGGVTFSGGEPLTQPAFLEALLAGCRETGVPSCVDTSGAVDWGLMAPLVDLVDLFLYDVKTLDEERHLELTGAPSNLPLDNLHRLVERGANLVLRYVVIPGITDGPEDARRLVDLVRSLPVPPPVELLPYHASWRGKLARIGLPSPSDPPTRRADAALVAGFGRALGAEGLVVL